jgi:succinate dehydrogenase/fumarate reductase cytochrome b subunit
MSEVIMIILLKVFVHLVISIRLPLNNYNNNYKYMHPVLNQCAFWFIATVFIGDVHTNKRYLHIGLPFISI